MEVQDQNTKTRRSWKGGILMCAALCLLTLLPSSAAAQSRLIVRDSLGISGINATCLLLGCNVVDAIGDPQGQLFVVNFGLLSPLTAILELKLQLGIVDVELDQTVKTLDATAGPAPSYLTNETPTKYYGATVWQGYVNQPATQLIRLAKTQSAFATTGAGVIVAVIDTGVDPTNPVLKNLLVNGYDFTRNMNGGSEDSDVSASPDLSQAGAAQVNQRTVAVLDQRTVAVLDGSQYNAFGHGTMTAGIVHLVAPQAQIMPLKSFNANGTGYDSDVLRAIYYAVKHGARVLSMSFDYTSYSPELANAIKYANSNGVVSVASAGNDGQQIMVIRAACRAWWMSLPSPTRTRNRYSPITAHPRCG